MTTKYDTDLQSQTVSAAWASTLARPSLEFTPRVADTDRVLEDTVPRPARPVLAAALLGGIAVTPVLGLAAYLFAGGTVPAPVSERTPVEPPPPPSPPPSWPPAWLPPLIPSMPAPPPPPPSQPDVVPGPNAIATIPDAPPTSRTP
jgi:hypothetical protein